MSAATMSTTTPTFKVASLYCGSRSVTVRRSRTCKGSVDHSDTLRKIPDIRQKS